jgi:predicted AlkP superfamily phosphohydrolase/phosphomutase/tetratricopeptide (TPR) repeat protein
MASRPAEKVLLIGWDAADWKLIRPLLAAGAMPHLKRLVDGGASGNLASLQPMLSPMLWTSAATGKHPHKHGIHGFTEPRPDGEGVRAASSTSRTTKAVWNILTQNGLRTHCVNWYASHPAEPVNGVCVSNRFLVVPPGPGKPWPLPEGAVYPPELRDALADLRVRPEGLDGSMLLPFAPQAARIDQARDKRLLALAVILAEAATTHAAITWCLEHRPWDFAAVLYNAIDQFCHLFMEYAPPKQPHVSDDDFEKYRGVVDGAYRFHDMMLGRLLQLAGGDATVIIVSDHGYRTGPQRLRETPRTLDGLSLNHRPQGVCVMHGPRVRRGQVLEGTGLLDVTPTVLTLLGLPVGADMDGRAWAEAMEPAPEVDRVMSWDDIGGDGGQHPPELREAPAESLEAIRHLIELGYVEPPDKNVRRMIDRTLEENRYNLARSLVDARQPTRAVPLLEELVRGRPEHPGYRHALFEAYYALGRYDDCRQIAEAMWARGYRGPLVNLGLAALEMAARRPGPALERLRQAERVSPDLPELHLLIGQAYLRLREWPEAERAFRKALELDVDHARAWHGLASAALGRGDFERAAELALRAVGLRGDYAEAHYHLGVALARLGRPREAAVALRRSVALRPNLLAGYRRLLDLYDGPLADPKQAREVRLQAEQVMLRRRMNRRVAPAGSSAPAASVPASGAGGTRPGG